MWERIDINGLILWALGGVTGAGMWLVRHVLTNGKQIELLKVHLDHRDEARRIERDADHEALIAMNEKVESIHTDVRELRGMMENRRVR